MTALVLVQRTTSMHTLVALQLLTEVVQLEHLIDLTLKLTDDLHGSLVLISHCCYSDVPFSFAVVAFCTLLAYLIIINYNHTSIRVCLIDGVLGFWGFGVLLRFFWFF